MKQLRLGMKCGKLTLLILVLMYILCGCQKENDSIVEYVVPEGAIELEAEVSDTYGNAKAIVTIISDDGVYDSCANLDRILHDRNLRCTVAGAVGIVEPYKEEWSELLQHGTIDIVSHSYNHVRMEDGSEIAQDLGALRYEIVDADKWYEDWLGYEQISFVCPENQMCKSGYEILQENDFWAVRRGHRGYNPLSPEEGIEEGQWSNLSVQGICDEGVDLFVRNGWIDTAIDDGVWLIEMWHNVMPEYDGGYQTILVSDAEKHLDYIVEKKATNDIWVATYDEAVKYIREKQNSKVYAYIEGGKLKLYSELINEEMSYETFNQPLTILVKLPDSYALNDTEEFVINDDVLTVNVVPGEELVIDLK